MSASHAGRLLISKPDLSDPNFDGTVILVLAHDAEGAFGVVLNRPLEVEVSDAFVGWEKVIGHQAKVLDGGPVEPDSVIALAQASSPGELALGLVSVDLAMGPTYAITSGVERMSVFAGYAGWGPGQLDGELAVGAWWLVQADLDDLFAVDTGSLWARVLKRGGGEMEWFAHYPADPSLN